MASKTPNLDQVLRKNFPVASDVAWETHDGRARGLPITGTLLRCTEPQELVSKFIKPLLPKDAVIIDWDGHLIRMRGVARASDEYVICFASKEWDIVEEGVTFPMMQPLYLMPPVSGNDPNWSKVIIPIQLMVKDSDYELVIDKDTHFIEFPKDRETENQFVVSIKAKSKSKLCPK